MQEFIANFLSLGQTPVVLLSVFIICFIGYALGSIQIKGLSLGTAGVFLFALLFGYLCTLPCLQNIPILGKLYMADATDAKISSFKFISNIGLVLFVTSVGSIAGPKFFRDLKANAKTYVPMGALIIVIGDQLARMRTEEDKKKYFIRTLIITGVVVLPILLSNLSTAVLICGIVFCLWVLARIPWKYTASIVGIAAITLVLGYCIVEFGYIRRGKKLTGPFSRATTWVARIDRHFESNDQSKYVLTDDNIQEVYSSVAIARGGTSPLGVLPGNSKERDYLPLAFADYIFAIIVEESGIIGAGFLIFLYLAILFRACYVSSRYSDMPAMFMTMGLALMITCQALISMLVAVGLGPVTGQPLPLISRGGTSVLITSIYFGIMMAVSREQTELSQRVQETKEESLEDAPIITLD